MQKGSHFIFLTTQKRFVKNLYLLFLLLNVIYITERQIQYAEQKNCDATGSRTPVVKYIRVSRVQPSRLRHGLSIQAY